MATTSTAEKSLRSFLSLLQQRHWLHCLGQRRGFKPSFKQTFLTSLDNVICMLPLEMMCSSSLHRQSAVVRPQNNLFFSSCWHYPLSALNTDIQQSRPCRKLDPRCCTDTYRAWSRDGYCNQVLNRP